MIYNNTHIRAFAYTDPKARLEGLKALIKAREEFKHAMEIRVVAFPQDGVIRDPWAEDYIRQAMEIGTDVVGGIPWIEYTDGDAKKHIDLMFDLAKKYDKDVSMLIDAAGDPGLRTLEILAVTTIAQGWEGRVTAQHARVRDLYAIGVAVALGQDDVRDSYYLYGSNNMLEVAFLASHLLWMTTFADMEILYDLITTNAARALSIPEFELIE